MARKADGVFTVMMNRFLLISIFLGFMSCDPVPPFNDIPYIPFDPVEVNINLAQYSKLRIDGGMEYVPGGVRGIIVYRENSLTYHAYERNCSWLPNDACATVDIDPNRLYMLDGCCSSVFVPPTGIPTSGPALYPLNKYRTSVNGSIITITDELVN